MLKWLIALVLALILFSGLENTLRKLGFGHLPGDFTLRLFGRDIRVPVASTILLSALMALIMVLL
ncbi:MAG: DUF2905 family protein [Burkholderiaceae bacterium]